MYSPKDFQETDIAVMHDLIRVHPLGAWIVHSHGELIANHIPFLLEPARGERGTLIAHVARANPVWQSLDSATDSLVIFRGPDAYISPSWYPSKHEDGRVVPTWNYAVVHVHGRARAIQDRDWLHRLVSRLTETHEQARQQPWKVSDAPNDYIERMLAAIVGIEIQITKLEGKWKASQNRTLADRQGVVAGLTNTGDAEARAMAEIVRSRR